MGLKGSEREKHLFLHLESLKPRRLLVSMATSPKYLTHKSTPKQLSFSRPSSREVLKVLLLIRISRKPVDVDARSSATHIQIFCGAMGALELTLGRQ